MLAELGRILPFDAFVWPLCDPRTAVGMAPRARIPCPQELPRLIRLKYLSGPGRWTTLMHASLPATTLLQAAHGDPSRSPVWNGLLQHYGVRDVLSVVFADKYGCWAWLDLWRTGGQGPMNGASSDHEIAYLGRVAEAVTPALRRATASEFGNVSVSASHPKSDPAAVRPDLPEPAVLTLDEELAIVGRTASVAEWLQLLQPGPFPHQHTPAEVLNVAAQLMAREAGVDTHEAECRVHVGAGHWASLRASRMAPGMPGSTPPLAVTIQSCSVPDRLDLFARAFGLTPRQGELLRLAAAGADTVAMAKARQVTAYTVQDQFKQVFQVCGVHSRAALLAMALGTGFRA
ncbi:helix-turn-helix transcriptional regulator [Arthrobacter sp. C152]